MQTHLLAINLFPDFAIVAAIVILAHWVWLFGFKNKLKTAASPISSKKIDTEASIAPTQLSGVPGDNLISPSATNDLYTTTQEVVVATEQQAPEVAGPPSRETILTDKYADVDMVATLEALQQGNLTTERRKELQELAFLTLSTEEKYPNPIDLELKKYSQSEEHLN